MVRRKIMLVVQFGFNEFQNVIDKIIELAEKSAKDSWEVPEKKEHDYQKKIKEISTTKLTPLYEIKEKKKRNESLNEKRKEILDAFQDDSVDDSQILEEIKKVNKEIVGLRF